MQITIYTLPTSNRDENFRGATSVRALRIARYAGYRLNRAPIFQREDRMLARRYD